MLSLNANRGNNAAVENERTNHMAVKDVFQAAVKTELAKSNNSKWGAEESLAVIVALIIDETGEPAVAENSELLGAIKTVINPSQFAQALESQKMLTRTGRAAKAKNALLDFGSK